MLIVIMAVTGLLAIMEQLSGGVTPSPAPSTKPAPSTPRPPTSPSRSTPAEQQGSNKTPAVKLGQDILALLSKSIPPERLPPQHVPLFKVKGAAHTDFLRNFAASEYDGKVWKVKEEAKQPYHGEEVVPSITKFSSAEKDTITVELLAKLASGFLPTSLNLERLLSSSPLVYYPDSGGFYSESNFPPSYTFSSVQYHFTEAILNSAQVIADERYLQIPENITPRTEDLAGEITQGFKTAYEKIKAIEHYLQVNYELDPSARKPPSGWEPNDWFLFEEKKGTDVNFNSALAILARLVGVPTRLATGFAGLEQTAGEQIVYADQTHTWVEVGFKDLGWVPFDATPPGPQPRVAEVPEREEENIPPSKGKTLTFIQITKATQLVRKGSWFKVEGEVQTEKGEGIDGALVEIFLSKNKQKGGKLVGNGETSAGHFEIKCRAPRWLKVGNYQLIAHALGNAQYSSSWSDPEVKLVAATKLELKLPEEAKAGQSLIIKGCLKEEYGYPVSGQEVEIWVGGKLIGKSLTNKTGEFAVKQVFSRPGKYRLKANFKGTEYYLPSSVVLELVVEGKGFPWWTLAFIPVGGGGLGGYLLRKRKRGKTSSLTKVTAAATLEHGPATALTKSKQKEGKGVNLTLVFPQIKEPFPPVWGLGEELKLVLFLRDGRGRGIGGKELEIWAGESLLARLLTDEEGKVSLNHTFTEKKEYLITGIFAGNEAYSKAKVAKLIRIVDYREEIVDLFNLLLEWFRGRGVSLPEGATPREIGKILSYQRGVEKKSLEMLIGSFEEAEYSSHPITRRHYELMFLAQKQLKEFYGEGNEQV